MCNTIDLLIARIKRESNNVFLYKDEDEDKIISVQRDRFLPETSK